LAKDSTHGNASLGGGMTPEIVPHLESIFDSSELADVVLVCKDGAEVRGLSFMCFLDN
jgi:hypothetical protein